jgi:GNAT superfamily N-acetyltransferase
MNAVTSVIYANEDPATFVDELQHLLPEHYEELCVTKDFPLLPDYEAYGRLAVNDMLRCITCRAEGNLIGYIIFIVQPHLHYMSCKTAFEDIYFVRKEFRQGRTGIRLFQYAEDVLKQDGVNRMIVHTKIHLDNSRLFEYLVYKHTDKLYTKILSTEPV